MDRRSASAVIGWDIGGVNTKAALVVVSAKVPEVSESRSEYYELQREPSALVPTLRRLAGGWGAVPLLAHAVTMTAELSQLFRTKREGVSFVLDAVAEAFPSEAVSVYTVAGRFVSPDEARENPIEVAASNWAATAAFVAREGGDTMMIDIGTTTTDIIPIVGGRIVAVGRTDPERLSSGELVYTGAVRTPVEALLADVPLWGKRAGVAAEGFALTGDVHLWLGRMAPDGYVSPTPDGRPATREFAGERLARVVCADREMLGDADLDAIAAAIADAQIERIAAGIAQVRSHWPEITSAIVTGLGDFIAMAAAHHAGLTVTHLETRLGPAARIAPAAAVAWLRAVEST